MHIPFKEALSQLSGSGKLFLELFSNSDVTVEIYKPVKEDLQQPHSRDEIYIIISGSGRFFNAGKTMPVVAGDFLFVPAFAEHRFFDFSDDFCTWVIFTGQEKTT